MSLYAVYTCHMGNQIKWKLVKMQRKVREFGQRAFVIVFVSQYVGEKEKERGEKGRENNGNIPLYVKQEKLI